ncbi:hypothetical protein L596_020184 [Steinernema carpocapsae]|uniref:BAR domain-containing protein n=1 Tax=Steinernema carpocapsae TaxID=34508 RepID=A0A4U5MTF6_STECR|nr:hypothetical protein L596_020184 [Steinernema carpocapsae]
MSSGGGAFKGILFKIGTSIGNVEKTKMTAEFNDSVQCYESYREKLGPLVDRLEGAVQQHPDVLKSNNMESPPNENPHELLACSLEIFKTYQAEDRVPALNDFISQRRKLAVCQRDGQLKARKAIRHLRRFFRVEYTEMRTENEKLTKIRDYMDMIKHDVKTAKNTEQIEKSALLYEEAVENFNHQAKRVIDLLDKLPSIQKSHMDEIVEFFEVMKKNNADLGQRINVYSHCKSVA